MIDIFCLGCKRSRVQIPAARPKFSRTYSRAGPVGVSLPSRPNRPRMNSRYPGVACEIPPIQGEEIGNAVDQRGCDEPCVMYLHSSHRVLNNQPAPLNVNALAVGQKSEPGFD